MGITVQAQLLLQWPSAWILPILLLVYGGSLLLLQQPTSAASRPTTAFVEAEAFMAVFHKWGISSKINWTTANDPCSGLASMDAISITDIRYNPFIKCDCSDDNGTTCHIISLKARGLDVVGEIPKELWNLTFLTYLCIVQNYLTGSVSPSIGNLKKMQWLYFSENVLSGNVPKEIGQLTGLKSLTFGTNNFTGSLPYEIGNIVGLQELYVRSSGVSGEIPSSFANLVNLQRFVASDTELNGTIPDFIGTWSQLTILMLEGNSFVGSIPSSFSNLTALQTLRLGDLSNGSSSLAFVTNLTLLSDLVLRNINFSDPIPSGIGGLRHLGYLDLSFNNIRGKIPDSLFSLGLYYLSLGNNKLTGSLPQNKNSSLVNIDVSYNELSGGLPSWVKDQNLQLNLVANNFDLTNNSALPSGLICLQNNFPCYRGSPRYSSFAVNCGGQQIRSSYGTLYETENENLGPATYYVVNTNRWAVSNAGYFLESDHPSFTASSSSPFINTLDPGLFQTARLSPGSLRYYGLGLENGKYTVILQFAELIFENGKTWRSHGRRVFDIYIQGNLTLKNFDIRKEAGGQSFSVVKKKFTALVMANYLEIHLRWAGKGTCCNPAHGIHGPSISAISVTPNFVPTVSDELPPISVKHKTGMVLAISLPVGCICLLFLVLCYAIQTNRKLREARAEGVTAGIATAVLVFDCYWLYQVQKRRKEKRRRAMNFARNGGLLLQEVASNDCVVEKTKIFTAQDLEKATDNFNKSRILGQGGQGTVYKGMLADGRIVAIKKSNMVDEGQLQQFINEVVILSQINNRNVVKLLGCCLETNVPLLVYEFVPNGTLLQCLHDPNQDFHITWKMRLQIAVESAGALAYLHSSTSVPIYHRDIKSSNILLDEKYRAKVSDFGISRTIRIEDQSHLTTTVRGTMGYLDPEYFRSNQFSDKSDVYSFGVVLLELLTGKKALIATELENRKALVIEFLEVMESSRICDIVDPRITEEATEKELWAVANLATRCLNMNGKRRPTMKEVAMTLEGVRSFPVANFMEEICLETNHEAHEIIKGYDVPFCSGSFQLQDASSSSYFGLLRSSSN